MKHYLLSMICLFMISYVYSQKNTYTISGYVSDSSSGEKLINANIYDPQSLVGTVSNTYGFYSLTLPKGKYKIAISFVGFTTQIVDIDLQDGDKEVNIYLENVNDIEEVVVMGKASQNKLQESQMSKEVLSMETVKNLPSFMGEVDIIKTLQLLPGVQSGSESSTGLYVRGGGPDQNLILLDGVPVYNANHLFGFFSVFNPDAVKNVTLYKGGFPARFGGRLSSVVDIRMKEGNEKELHGGFQVGLISSKVHLEGPLKKDKTSFHISGRRTYIDLLTRPMMPADDKIGYFFYDFNSKLNHKFSDKDRLYISVYTGKDRAYMIYDIENSYYQGVSTRDESKMLWGNLTTALRWNHIYNNKLFSNTMITYSKYKFIIGSEQNKSYNIYEGKEEECYLYKYQSGIDDFSARFEFDWYPNTSNSVKFGLNYINHSFKPGIEVINEIKNNENRSNQVGGEITTGHELSAFFEDDVNLFPKIKANIGICFSSFSVENTLYTSVEPRLSARYLTLDNLSFKVAYSKMKQYLHLLSNSSVGLPTDLWLPVTKKIKPQISHQYALGAVYNMADGYSFSAEVYYKEMNNVIDYKEGATFNGAGIDWEDKVETGIGESYGLELLLKMERGKSNGWLGYTWSKSQRKFNNLNNGRWFKAKHDRTHDISAVYNYKVSDKLDFGATWVFGTGDAITLPTNKIEVIERLDSYNVENGNTVSYFKERNDYRMPNYHRLDVGFNFHKKKKRGTRTWSVSIYNVYNRRNAFFIYPSGEKLKKESLFPILPSVSYSYKF